MSEKKHMRAGGKARHWAALSVLVLLVIPSVGLSGALAQTSGDPLCGPTILFIGARGSGEPGRSDDSQYGTDLAHLGAPVREVWETFSQNALVRNHGVGQVSVAYPAVNVFPAFLNDGYRDSVDRGIASLTRLLDARFECPSTNRRVVLSGYSQGAQVIKETLLSYPQTPFAGLFDGVVLIADPTWSSDEVYWVGDARSSDQGILGELSMPPLYLSRTLQVCDDKDPVCSTQGGDDNPLNKKSHTRYVSHRADWLVSAGRWLVYKRHGVSVSSLTGNIVRNSSTGESWFVKEDGRYFIPTGAIFRCLEGNGAKVKNVSSDVRAAIPNRWGHRATCIPFPNGTTTTQGTTTTTSP